MRVKEIKNLEGNIIGLDIKLKEYNNTHPKCIFDDSTLIHTQYNLYYCEDCDLEYYYDHEDEKYYLLVLEKEEDIENKKWKSLFQKLENKEKKLNGDNKGI